MEFKVTGKIIRMLPIQTGEGKNGAWKKQSFVVDTGDQYNNIYCFDIFGSEKVDNFNKYNALEATVTVKFNIRANEYEGKYYTNLDAWNVRKADGVDSQEQPERPPEINGGEEPDDLPF